MPTGRFTYGCVNAKTTSFSFSARILTASPGVYFSEWDSSLFSRPPFPSAIRRLFRSRMFFFVPTRPQNSAYRSSGGLSVCLSHFPIFFGFPLPLRSPVGFPRTKVEGMRDAALAGDISLDSMDTAMRYFNNDIPFVGISTSRTRMRDLSNCIFWAMDAPPVAAMLSTSPRRGRWGAIPLAECFTFGRYIPCHYETHGVCYPGVGRHVAVRMPLA